MKVQKPAAIVLIMTTFSVIAGNSPSQAQVNIHYTPESFNNSSITKSLTPMETKQSLKRKPPLERAAMDNILQLTTEQVIKKNNLLEKLAYNLNAIDKELTDSLNNSQSRNVALAISKEKKTALNRNFFAEFRRMLTPKQLQNKKGLDYLAKYEEFWVATFS
jgi:DNA replication protein DnaD